MRQCLTATRTKVLGAVVLLGMAMGPAQGKNDGNGNDHEPSAKKTRPIMRSLFQHLAAVLPASFEGDSFRSPKSAKALKEHIDALVDGVDTLEHHALGKSRGFEYLAHSLARDVRNVQHWYENEMYRKAQFTLHNLTENCTACHSRLPDKSSFPAPEKFFAKVDGQDLSPLKRAHLFVMSRQFDKALSTYEAYLGKKPFDPMTFALSEGMTEYFKVAIRVKQDFDRPAEFLKEIAGRPETPLPVKRQMTQWRKALERLSKKDTLKKPDLASARKVIEAGREKMEFQRDRDGLVHYVTASAMLQQVLDEDGLSSRKRGETYYLLGVTESVVADKFWLSEMEFYLETAIRIAPRSDFAPKAYARLAEHLITGYTGSSGTHLPPDVKARLRELKALIDASGEGE